MTPVSARTAALVVAVLSAGPALAQEAGDPWRLSIGAGAVYRPEFKGSDDYEVQPFPLINFSRSFGDMSLNVQGSTLRLDLRGSDTLAMGPVLAYQQGRDDDISNATVRALGEIDAAIEGGVFIEQRWRVGSGQLSVGATALTDVSGAHDGASIALNAGYRRPLASRLFLSLNSALTWANDDYMATYYGVSPTGALASGLPAYEAGSGLEKAGVSAALLYQINDRWGLVGLAGYDRLLDRAADSPIVALEGSPDQFSGGLALSYRF